MYCLVGLYTFILIYLASGLIQQDWVTRTKPLDTVFFYLQLAGYFMFALCMVWFAETSGLRSLKVYWKRCLYVFGVCYSIFIGIMIADKIIDESRVALRIPLVLIGALSLIIALLVMARAVYSTYKKLKNYTRSF